jgi:hypothetical protein
MITVLEEASIRGFRVTMVSVEVTELSANG